MNKPQGVQPAELAGATGSAMRDQWRVGKRTGQNLWQIKQAPGWRVAQQVATLPEAAAWLIERGADICMVPVLSVWPWKSLAGHIRVDSQNNKVRHGSEPLPAPTGSPNEK